MIPAWVELLLFITFGLVAIGGGLLMVGARNTVYSAMGLLATLFSVAVFYVMNLGHFIAAVQVIVYAGAIMTLFLFVIMLIGVDKSEDNVETLPLQRPAAVAGGAALLLLVVLAGRNAWVTGPDKAFGGAPLNGTIENVSRELFTGWLLPFEITAILLTIAAVGTIALAQFGQRKRVLEVAGEEPGTAAGDTAAAGTAAADPAAADFAAEPSATEEAGV